MLKQQADRFRDQPPTKPPERLRIDFLTDPKTFSSHHNAGNQQFTTAMQQASEWSDTQLELGNIPILDVPVATIGGGLGSFALADTLRISGVTQNELMVLSLLDSPTDTYRRLAHASQIPDHERLRSDSASTIDNIWGFPSYALRESVSTNGIANRVKPLLNVLFEPVLGIAFYTPRAGQVYQSVENELARIGWPQMLQRGQVSVVRKRVNGGYFSLLTKPDASRVAIRSRFVHLALGYPGIKVLDDLQQYIDANQQNPDQIVNAYAPHDFVYEDLLGSPKTVLVRGSGIVASRILQRLLDDREERGAETTVLHLFRNYVDGPQRFSGPNNFSPWMTRPGGNGFAYQGFNFPKSSWGGQLKDRLESLDDGQERSTLIRQLGGTNTAPRRSWRRQLKRGESQGYYKQYIGVVANIDAMSSGRVCLTIHDSGNTYPLEVDYIIDATGLEGDICDSRLISDLLEFSGASRNAHGRLAVTRAFEVQGTRSGDGRMYASGSATLGGYYAGVDSFLGLQYAALQIADDLANQGFGERLGIRRSLREWWRWARKRPVNGTVPSTHLPSALSSQREGSSR